jgi:tryptophan 2,3-dioxygenase
MLKFVGTFFTSKQQSKMQRRNNCVISMQRWLGNRLHSPSSHDGASRTRRSCSYKCSYNNEAACASQPPQTTNQPALSQPPHAPNKPVSSQPCQRNKDDQHKMAAIQASHDYYVCEGQKYWPIRTLLEQLIKDIDNYGPHDNEQLYDNE